ncbi:hypothetical protein [Corynebacterium argentoratense]|uniref:hypothetical protein n=1 Tax=Corynebacterium argentoratense TaxID=42817 RepID=UPI001F46EE85|nr:hypothetical protein [Corynebacterium argentoratense]MCF1765011.1 hypothetical protein [Corynebacterium argentoratense]
MKLFDRLRRRDTYEFEVDGYHFRVVVTPGTHTVEWLDCRSPYVPSGYSATRMYSTAQPMSKLRERYYHWRYAPLPSKDDIFRLEADQQCPPEAFAIAFMYWEFLAEGGRKEPLLFQEQETSSIPAALGVRGALKTANAISTARVEGAHCATCDGPLTLKNRQALQKFAAKHTAKCRTCEGVNDIELRKTKQALLRASKEKEAQLHELDDFDPTTLLNFTGPISFDDPKILQAKQKLVDISRRARHKEYADIEQLIDAIPTAELPGLWAAANSSFLTY